MYSKKLFITFSHLLALFFIQNSFAEHRDSGEALSQLVSNSTELNYAVQNTWLRFPVKMAVSGFAHQVQKLERCMTGDFSGGPFDGRIYLEKEHRLPGGDFIRCGYLVSRVYEKFEIVDRYLHDTDDDFPRIYELYIETRETLEQLRSY